MQAIAEEIGRERVAAIVAAFYAAVRQHATLAQPFARVSDWPHHLEVLSHFWWVTLGGAPYLDYTYRVAARHAEAGFTPALLQDWIALFRDIVSTHLPTPLVAGWMQRVERIGESLRLMHDAGQYAASA